MLRAAVSLIACPFESRCLTLLSTASDGLRPPSPIALEFADENASQADGTLEPSTGPHLRGTQLLRAAQMTEQPLQPPPPQRMPIKAIVTLSVTLSTSRCRSDDSSTCAAGASTVTPPATAHEDDKWQRSRRARRQRSESIIVITIRPRGSASLLHQELAHLPVTFLERVSEAEVHQNRVEQIDPMDAPGVQTIDVDHNLERRLVELVSLFYRSERARALLYPRRATEAVNLRLRRMGELGYAHC